MVKCQAYEFQGGAVKIIVRGFTAYVEVKQQEKGQLKDNFLEIFYDIVLKLL